MKAALMGILLAAAACTPSTTTPEKSVPLPVILVAPPHAEPIPAFTPKHTKKDESSITQQLNVLQGQLDWVSKRLPKEKE
jgi:hypothetical protein